MASIQQNRIVRFLMVLTAVVLTILIYASYYSNPAMTISTRIHSSALVSTEIDGANDDGNGDENDINNINSNSIQKKQQRQQQNINEYRKNSNFILTVDKQNSKRFQIQNYEQEMNASFAQQYFDNGAQDSPSSVISVQQQEQQQQKTSSEIAGNIKEMTNSIIGTTRNSSSPLSIGNKSMNSTSTLSSSSSLPSSSSSSSSLSSSLSASLSSISSSSPAVPLSSVISSSSTLSQSKSAIASHSPGGGTNIGGGGGGGVNNSKNINNNNNNNNGAVKGNNGGGGGGGGGGSVITKIEPLDPSKGIPTASIYESGHLDTNPNLCPDEGESLRLLIVITSAPTHRDARLAIRQTWGHYGTRRDVAIAFVLGRTINQAIEDSLTSENYMYGDLIRGHFIDSYNNLTLKTISVLEWVERNCPKATYVLKTDDDMFINVPKLLGFIDKHNKDKRVIYGRLAKKWKPIRNKKSKYFVSSGQFAQAIFPQFTTGPAYLMSSDIVHDLYVKALEQTYLKLEDVFTTGIVAQLLNIKRIHVNEFLNRRIAFNPCNIRKAISVHMVKSNEQFDLWKKLLDTSTKCK